MTCQRLTDYAGKNDLPMLVVHASRKTEKRSKGSVTYASFKRSAVSIPMDEELAYDPLFQRHSNHVLRELLAFQPDVIHITGLNDVSIIGSYLAWKLQIPLVGSWHTNLHEFAAERLRKLLRKAPAGFASRVAALAERKIFDGSMLYYKIPLVLLAPNQELIDQLKMRTNRPSFLMGRGVDTEVFSPQCRTISDGVIRLGSVGRLRAEKNVRMLIEIEKSLLEKGHSNFEFLIVGEGSEREHLEKNLKHATFTGFLAGEKLSEAYANMDIFLFPSETDSFGNVAQEAAASGVVPIVSDKGGPKYLVDHGQTGFIAKDTAAFVEHIAELLRDVERLRSMKLAARESALSKSWDSVFEGVYDAYREAIRIAEAKKAARLQAKQAANSD